MKPRLDIVYIVAFFALLFILPIYIFIMCTFQVEECDAWKIITDVGGCDRHGDCGVIFEDGSHSILSYPTKGKACVRSHWRWK